MNEQTQPTDAELIASATEEQFLLFCDTDEFTDIARAVLAKWGSPVVAGEVVACGNCGGSGRMVRDPDIGTDQECFVCDGSGSFSEPATTQPTQAQASFKSGAKSFQTYAEANAYSKGYYAGKKAATKAQAGVVPLPKFLALKFHARRDKKATVTLLFQDHEAADAWVRGIRHEGADHG